MEVLECYECIFGSTQFVSNKQPIAVAGIARVFAALRVSSFLKIRKTAEGAIHQENGKLVS